MMKCENNNPGVSTSAMANIVLGLVSRMAASMLLIAGILGTHVQALDPSYELDNQVVSATGLISEAENAPIRTEVISARQLEFMQAKVLTDALQYSTGLKVQKTVKQGSKISMQGIDANYVLVLKDGLPFISPTGSETDLSQISLAGIERIEIIKGSGSALYGSSAMAGVINLISKETDISQLELDLQQGQYQSGSQSQLEQHSIFASKLLGQQRISLQAFRKLSPETDLDSHTNIEDGASQALNNFELRIDHHHSPCFITNINSKSYLRVNYLSDEKVRRLEDVIYPPQDSVAGEYNTVSDKISLDAGIRQLSSRLFDQGSIMMRYEGYEEQSGNWDERAQDKKQRTVDTQLFKIESQFHNQFQSAGASHALGYGVSYQQNTMKQRKIETAALEVDEQSSALEIYLQDNIITSDFGEFVTGVRVQQDSGFGVHSNAKLNWMKSVFDYKNITSKLRLSYGQGFRAPDLKQRFYNFDHSNLGYVIKGNSELLPEESNNINASLSLSHFGNLLELSAYYNDYKNKIETVFTGEVNRISQNQYQNIGRAITKGYDISLTIQPSESLYWQQGLAYLEADNLDNHERIEEQPRWSYKTQLNYAVNHQWVLSLYGNLERDSYKGKYDSDGDDVADTERATTQDLIQTWDVKASFKLNSQIKFSAGIDNLLNETKDSGINANIEVDDRPIEARLFTLGLNLTF
jgi:outer membrane receptor for ferrienterochelin and colicins